MKIYRMVIEKVNKDKNAPAVRKTYESVQQGAAPAGWRCVGVCGFYEKPKKTGG